MSLNISNISIVHWFPHLENHKCGYCKSEIGSISYGMWAETMTVRDYQNLIDRGWRRSGRYCYKPILNQTCCPQYTIRCDALSFKLSKSHKKIIKRINKFLNDGILNINEKLSEGENDCSDTMFLVRDKPNVNFDYKNLNIELKDNSDSLSSIGCVASSSTSETQKDESKMVFESSIKKVKVDEPNTSTISQAISKGLGADPSKPPCKKAKLLRIERKRQKMLGKGLTFVNTNRNNEVKSLEQFLNEISDNYKHKLEMKLVSITNSADTFSDFDTEYELYKKYQMIIHNDPPQKCTKKAFGRFLVNTPLKYEKWDNSDELGFGSFHQQYWIDDKLIAVGVIDILPNCVSSVYFFYDPDYRSLTLGTYGSLREVEFVRKLHESMPSINHYYMGFYIHTCPKMRYKGKLVPSDLLCPETYQWFPITDCIPKLEVNKYRRFNQDPTAGDEHACTSADIDRIKIFMFDGYVHFGSYKHRNTERSVYENIGKLVGKKCLETILFVKQ